MPGCGSCSGTHSSDSSLMLEVLSGLRMLRPPVVQRDMLGPKEGSAQGSSEEGDPGKRGEWVASVGPVFQSGWARDQLCPPLQLGGQESASTPAQQRMQWRPPEKPGPLTRASPQSGRPTWPGQTVQLHGPGPTAGPPSSAAPAQTAAPPGPARAGPPPGAPSLWPQCRSGRSGRCWPLRAASRERRAGEGWLPPSRPAQPASAHPSVPWCHLLPPHSSPSAREDLGLGLQLRGASVGLCRGPGAAWKCRLLTSRKSSLARADCWGRALRLPSSVVSPWGPPRMPRLPSGSSRPR